MSSILKQKREETGREIGEVASNTRIKESVLRSIEEEEYDKLPIEVYTRGYIKEYAKYLGLSPDSALEPYERYLEIKKGATGPKAGISESPEPPKRTEKPAQVEKAAYCKDAGSEKEIPHGSVPDKDKAGRSRAVWKIVLMLLVLAAVGYQFMSSRNAEKETYIPPIATQTQPQTTPVEPAPKTESETAPATMPATGEVKPPETPAQAVKKHTLEISANETTWVQVIMDGSEKKEALMKQGDKAVYEANDFMKVIVGNAGGVTMKFDGRVLPAGKKGEVLRLTLPENKAAGTPSGFKANPPKNINKTPAKVDRNVREEESEDGAESTGKTAGDAKP